MRMIFRPLAFLSFIFAVFWAPAYTQQSSPPRATVDAQSAALIQKALAALNGTTAVFDVRLAGTATRTAGSDIKTGSITLEALGTNQSRVDFVSSTGTQSELRNMDTKRRPQGFLIDAEGVAHPVPGHNTLTDAVWFFPALSCLSQTNKSYLAASYVGQEMRDGVSVHHLHFYFQVQSPTPPSKIPQGLSHLSGMEVYVDAASSLPVAVAFATHPDSNALIGIPVEVDFANYQAVSGIQVPFHIRKLVNGTLFYDIKLQSASVNSGLSMSDFAVQ